MTDKTEKQASPGPFDDKNLGELFQIALVNAPSPSKNAFNWGAFKPEAVKSPADLPPYLVFGPLNEGTFLLTPEGWRAEWSDAQQKAKITLNWGANTHRYTATQVWEGEEGSATEQPDTTPLIQVFAMLYENGLPSMWDQLAKKKAEEMYHLTWLVGDKRLPTYFAAPDGIFRVISFLVMIKNLRHAQSILKSIAEKNPSYGFYAIANLMEQDVYYEIGKAPDWTSDIALCMTQSIGETGLIPSGVPSSETIEGKEYIHLERDVMMLNISVPFAHIFEMLKDLSETPMPILPAYEAPMRRETLPVILPQGLSERLNSFTLDDTIQGIRVQYSYPVQEASLDDLLKLDSADQIDRLEKFSDHMLDQLTADVQKESEKDLKE